MKVKNRAQLLKILKEQCAYDGEPTLKAVRAFLEENSDFIKLEFEGGTDLDSLWKKAVTLQCDSPEDVRLVPTSGGEPDGAAAGDDEEDEEKPMVARSVRDVPGSKAGAEKTGKVHAALVHTDGKGGIYSAAVRAANARVKAYGFGKGPSQAKFSDGETALAAGAWYRYQTLSGPASVGLVTYSKAREDMAVMQDFFGKAGAEEFIHTGGATVPDQFMADLIFLTEQYGVARRVCNVVNMSSDSGIFPRKTAIGAAAWSGENATLTANDDSFDNVQLTARKLARLIRFSSELAEDSAINLAASYNESIAETFANKEDDAFINGDGTAAYGSQVGLDNALPTSAYVTGAAWASFTVAQLLTGPGLVENANLSRSGFICSRQFYVQVMVRLSAAAGGTTMQDMFNGPGIGSADGSFLGWPVYFSQVCPTATGTAPTAFFGDFSAAAMFGDRRAPTIKTSEHRYFDQDQFAILATERVHINVHGDGKASTYGPVIGYNVS